MADIENCLVEALRMTEQLAERVVEPEELKVLIDARAPLLDAAAQAREGGAAWGERETSLAELILQADQRILKRLWEPRKDAFGWLMERDPEVEAKMPSLAALRDRF